MAPFDLDRFLAELLTWADEGGSAAETVAYGAHPEQRLDLRLPPGGAERAVVLLHGGFWRAGYRRALMTALAVDLTRRGWATANVEYRRVGTGGGVPVTLDDVRAALRHARRLLAPRGIAVVGHSAGGQLALWAAGTGDVDAAVSLGGVCDLTRAARDRIGSGAVLDFVGGDPGERPEAYALADPMHRVPARVPTLALHGALDGVVPPDQSRRYAAVAGERCELLELPGVGHFEPIDPRSAAWAAAATRLERMLPMQWLGRN